MKGLKRFLLVLLIVLLCIIPLFAGLVYWFGKDIKQYAVAKLSSSLAVEVKISDVELSVFSQFPKVSLLFTDVVIYENYFKRKQELLTASEILVSFSLSDLWNKQYHINELTVRKGSVNIYYDAKGRDNFTILKESEGGDGDSLQLQLEKIRLSDMKLRYEDRGMQILIKTDVKETDLKGNFYDTQFKLAWKGAFHFDSLRSGKVNYLLGRNVKMDSELEVDLSKDHYVFKKSALEIEGLAFWVSGDVKLLAHDKGTDFNMDIRGDELDIQSFLSLLPEEHRELFKDYKSKGDFYLHTSLKGILNKKENPSVKTDFGIKNGEIYKSGVSYGLEHLSLEGSFSNGIRKNAVTSVLQISNMKTRLGDNDISAGLKIENLNDPLLSAQLHGNLDLQKLAALLELPLIESLKGFAFADVNLSGRIADMKDKRTAVKTHSDGQMKFSNIELRLKDVPHQYKVTSGLFKLNGNNFYVDDFALQADETSLSLNGSIRNFLPYMLLDSQQLHIQAQLKAPFIDLEKIFFSNRNQERMDSSGFVFPADISMDFNLDVARLKLYRFRAEQVTGSIHLHEKVLKTSNLKFQAMNGQAQLSGEMDNRSKDKVLIRCDADLKSIDINQLFYQCENFGQKELTDKHLLGKLDAKVQFASVWNANFDCDLDKVVTLADISISNGEIINYEPMLALSKYADVKELKHLKFEKLSQSIQISQQKIFIPQTEIRNNALNLTLSGTHTFENYLDYRFRVRLSDVLRKKRNKPVNNEFEEEDEQGGGLFIYLAMKGPMDNLSISYDKISVKKKIKENMQAEKQNIKEILKKEFQSEDDRKLKEEEKKQEKEINWEDDVPE